jgi:hypothetical protein
LPQTDEEVKGVVVYVMKEKDFLDDEIVVPCVVEGR